MIAASLALILAAEQAAPPNFPFDPATTARLRASHVEGNVPPKDVFDRYLERDLIAYFAAQGLDQPSVEYELLRRGPTQSGMSWPKFYLWVRVRAGGRLSFEGAARVSAINRGGFDISDVLRRSDIVASPDRVGAIFPAPLVPEIDRRARALSAED